VHVNVKEAKLHQLPVVRVLDDKRITFFGSIVQLCPSFRSFTAYVVRHVAWTKKIG
jgi:hypothetical protein